MTVLFIVLPVAVLLASAAVWGFIWMVRSGQFDDLDTPAIRLLTDEEPAPNREPADK